MKLFPVKCKGKIINVMIDDEDFNIVSRYRWNINGAGRALTNKKYNGKNIYMHRLILNVKKDKWVDHIDGNPLNNQKINLRLCTKKQNWYNRKLNSNNTTGYKGVYRLGNRYFAAISVDNRNIHLGIFRTAVEAARKYDEANKKHFGDFGRRNFDTS